MRVAYLVNQYPRNSHSFIRREIRAVEANGIEVLRFSLRPSDEELATEADREELRRTRVILDEGIAGHALAVARDAVRRPLALSETARIAARLGSRSDRGLLRHAAYVAEACVLASWLRRSGVDHVHAHFGTNSAMVAMLCRALGGSPFSFTAHGPEEFDKPEFIALGEKIHAAKFVVAVSSFGRSQLYRWARQEDWSKLHVVRCGVDDELLHQAPTAIPAAPRFVCVARLSEQKGHLLLLEAAARLASEGAEFEIVLAGDGPLRATIERTIARERLESRVKLAGWMSAQGVRDALVASRALVLPSFAEGLPVSVMESLALGRPVITTAIAGIPELVESGRTGWLVAAGDVTGLVAAMRAALEAPPAALEAMGRAGAAQVARDHDVAEEGRKLAALFRAGASGTRGSAAAASPVDPGAPTVTDGGADVPGRAAAS